MSDLDNSYDNWDTDADVVRIVSCLGKVQGEAKKCSPTKTAISQK